MGAEQTQTTVTRLLEALQAGNYDALDALFPLVYDELKGLAHRQRRYWQGNYTLNTTALVNEAYLKLVGPAPLEVESRAHFFALAAKAMRHILCNYARDRRTQKRGGGAEHLPLDEAMGAGRQVVFSEEQAHTLLALDDALRRLEKSDPRQSKIVECRFFGGLTVEETAAALDISPRTVKRDWAMAQAWLQGEMESQT